VLGVLLAAWCATAAAKPVPWVVLVRSDGAEPAAWSEALQSAAREAADGTSVRVVPPPAISLDEVQLTLGCGSWSNTCAGRVAGTMNAGVALVVELAKAQSEDEQIAWTVVSAAGNVIRERQTATLPDRGDAGLQAAQRYVAAAIRGARPTVVIVTADLPGAEVFVDGSRRGATPLTLIDDVTPGPHEIRVTYEARAPATRKVEVKAGATNRYELVLGANPPPPLSPSVGTELPNGQVSPVVAWSTVGLGGASIVGAGAVGLVWLAQARDLEDRLAQRDERGAVIGISQVDAFAQSDRITALAVTTLGLVGVGTLLVGTGAALLLVGADEGPSGGASEGAAASR